MLLLMRVDDTCTRRTLVTQQTHNTQTKTNDIRGNCRLLLDAENGSALAADGRPDNVKGLLML